ncbi:MAG: DUF2069 domain-containing protein [Gammaproteobacteria bacterium]|nr:DUF2069 domain-containing protein [Gammaproteobacteria bacterium]MCP5136499.1 DUF2069 domain-containing protein [Gammaproteobacteria bacterium]
MNAKSLARWALLFGHIGLIGFLGAWLIWLSPSKYFPVAMGLIFLVGPLLLPLWGLLHERKRAIAWAIYLSLPYFTLGVGEAFAIPDERAYGLMIVALSLLMFLGAMFSLRLSRSSATPPR